MYSFVGVDYWGSGDKSLAEFKKAFQKKIRPDEMKAAFAYIKAEYKKKHSNK